MNVLATLLPGVRAVRTPLAVGLVWLAVLWTALEGPVSDWSQADGILESWGRLDPVFSAIGVATCITFAAYVIGSVYLAAIAGVGRLTVMLYEAREGILPMDRREARRMNLTRGDFRGRSARLPPLPLEVYHRLVAHVADRLQQAEGPDETTNDAAVRASARDRVAENIVSSMRVQEWERLPLTIVGERPELYAEIDRYQSESEFRKALVAPLAALLVVGGIRVGGAAVIAVSICAALLAGRLLSVAARDSATRANTLIAHAVIAGKIPAQTLDDHLAGRGELHLLYDVFAEVKTESRVESEGG